MSKETKDQLLSKLRRRYATAGPSFKSKLLDQAIEYLGYHRKAAIRALRAKRTVSDGALPILGRPKTYQAEKLLPVNPKVVSFSEHYGCVILPAKPGMARHKGKVDAGVKYVQSNALSGRTFSSLAQQNQFLTQWEHDVADTRIHGTTRQQVRLRFETLDRPALGPLARTFSPSLARRRAKCTATDMWRWTKPIIRLRRSM